MASSAVLRVRIDLLGEVRFWAASRRIVKSLDPLIVCGRREPTEKDGAWGFSYTIFKWIALAKAAGVSYAFFNVGAGPLSGPLSKLFAKRALLAADYVSLRDRKSQTLVRDIEFARESWVYPDSAYGLEVVPAEHGVREGGTQPIVGLAPMPYPELYPDGYQLESNRIAYEAFIGKLAGFGSWLVSQSYALALSLTKRFESMVQNADEIKSRMAMKLTSNRQLLANEFDQLFDRFERRMRWTSAS